METGGSLVVTKGLTLSGFLIVPLQKFKEILDFEEEKEG
jgi:hypothetical protein